MTLVVTLMGLELLPSWPLLPSQFKVRFVPPMAMFRDGDDVSTQVLLVEMVTSSVQVMLEPEMLQARKGVPTKLAALPATRVWVVLHAACTTPAMLIETAKANPTSSRLQFIFIFPPKIASLAELCRSAVAGAAKQKLTQ
jgi:hypothetical protein